MNTLDKNPVDNLAKNILDCKDRVVGGKARLVTVIVGAGASRSSPTTQELKKELTSGKYLSWNVFNTNAHVHFGKDNVDNCTLEELCSIYATLKGQKVVPDFLSNFSLTREGVTIKVVKARSNSKPTPGYEFLAHLAHHNLVNSIISTNFDEELDMSLDDEIGGENFLSIKTPPEFEEFLPKLKEIGLANFRRPILLKVHGTISVPSELKSTIENVQKFEEKKFEVLKWILYHTSVLIIIGFSLKDADFQDVLIQAMEEIRKSNYHQPHVYWVDNNPRFKEAYTKDPAYEPIREQWKSVNPCFIPLGSDEFFEDLAQYFEVENTREEILPTIARHKIRNLVLQKADSNEIARNKFLLEVIIFAIKTKGLFSIDALTSCVRIQRFCRDLKLKHLYDLLDKLKEKNLIAPVPKKIGLYYVPVSKDNHTQEISERITDFFKLKNKLTKEEKKQLETHIGTLEETFDVDMVEPDICTYLMFRHPEKISERKDWDEKNKDFFSSNPNEICIIAQTGEWVSKSERIEHFLSDKKNILKLIACEKFEKCGLHSKRQKGVEEKLRQMNVNGNLEIRYLPWETVSEHMRLNGKNQGIYMRRLTKSPNVAPIWISDFNDYEILKNIFDSYWARAEKLATT